MHLLRIGAGQSISELARLSGLGKATVSRTVARLKDAGLVEETGEQLASKGRGRSAIGLRLRPDAETHIGLHIRNDRIVAVATDAGRTPLCELTVPVDYPGDLDARVAVLVDTVHEVLEAARRPPDRLAGVAIAIAAPIHPETRDVGPAVRLPQWHGTSVETPLARALGVPVVLENDSYCTAMYEVASGRIGPDQSFAYIHLDKGVGGAVILRGQMWRGHTGRAGNFGHVSFKPDGDICRCGGRGCYEQFVSVPALLDRLEPAFGPLSFAEVLTHVTQGQHAVTRAVVETADIVGKLLASLSRSIDPPMFLLGGQMVHLGPVFSNAVDESLRARNPAAGDIRITDLGGLENTTATALGAIALQVATSAP